MALKYARSAGGNWATDATWSTTSNGAADTTAPTAADDVVLDASSGNVTIDTTPVCRSLNCSSYTATLTHNAVTLSIGDGTAGASNIALKFSTAMTYTLANAITSAIDFVSTSATQQTVDFARKTSGNVTYNASSNGSWLMTGDHLTGATATVTLTKGTLNTNGYYCNWGIFSSSNTNVRALTLGTSVIRLLSTAATTVWNIGTATNLTLSAASSTIIIANASTNVRTISPGSGNIYGTLTYTITGSTGRLDLFTSHTWNTINFWDTTNVRTLRFQSGTTITMTNWNIRGSAAKLMTTDSSSAGSAFTLSKTSGTVSCDYLSIKDVTATGGARFYAGANSTDVSGNTGWTFTAPVKLMQDLQEDFEFGGIDDGKWTNSGSSQVVIGTNLDLRLTSALGGNYVDLHSTSTYSLVGSYAFIQLVSAGNQSLTSWEVYPLYLIADSNNKVFIRVAGNSIQCIKVVGGVTTDVGSSLAYNSAVHKWFRIREASGRTYFEYATDPTASWTEITPNIANVITMTAITAEVLVGTWQAESSTTTAILDNFNVLPGSLQFDWKGYTWNKRVHAANPANNQTWSASNVVTPDANDYIKLKLTNNGYSPVGCEIFSTQRGFGYGVYTVVVATRMDNMHAAVGFGGLFTFDFTAWPDYKEIDVHETRPYAGLPAKQLLKNHVWNNGGSREFVTSNMDYPADTLQTHRLIWEPNKLTFDSYIGGDTSGTNYMHSEHTEHLPTPGLERAHFNIFVDTSVSGYANADPIDVIIRSFTYTLNQQNNQSGSLSSAEHDWYATRSGLPSHASLIAHKIAYYNSKGFGGKPFSQLERMWLQSVGSTSSNNPFELWLRACQAQSVGVGRTLSECKMKFFTTVASGTNP